MELSRLGIWGALDVDSPDAAREVLDHTVVASTAYVSRLLQESPGSLGLACFKAAQPQMPDAHDDPAAPLRWMDQVEALLRDNGAGPQWHGLATFVWVIDAPSLESAARAVGPVAAADELRGIPLYCGVAHGTEAPDPGDLLRLAAYRSALAGAGQPMSDARPPMVSAEFALSQGEEARLALICRNRARDIEPLVREALDLLHARYC